jgi:hypothetical protein
LRLSVNPKAKFIVGMYQQLGLLTANFSWKIELLEGFGTSSLANRMFEGNTEICDLSP